MGYVKPETVLSPRNKVGGVDVLYDVGDKEDGSWSVAEVKWEGKRRIGVRWNGSGPAHQGRGNPTSRGQPTWFLLPEELQEVVEQRIRQLPNSEERKLQAGYVAMAADREREAEADGWSEDLLSDATDPQR